MSTDPITRRALLSAAGVGAGAARLHAAESQPAEELSIERVPLGKTGVKVSRLGIGASFPEYGRRLLDFAYRCGVRYFDNSENYVGGKSEGIIGDWVARMGRRDDVFLVTKTHARDPQRVYQRVVEALARIKVDTIDLFFLHGIDDPAIPLDGNGDWRRLKERLVREKKIRFMGFSTHAEMGRRCACLANAAAGGWVDALMVACDPGLIRTHAEFGKALDACARAGVGLVCMKSTRGLGKAQNQPAKAREAFERLGLSPYAAMMAGIWSDGRFAAVCSEMPNLKIIEENAAAARTFRKPFDEQQWKALDEGIRGLARATCPGCDGSCRLAGGVETDFSAIARCVAYHDESGNRALAREVFSALPPEQRDWEGADLDAASQACRARLDFAHILRRARSLFG